MIETAILLAAGEGSRLRSVTPFKPLCTVAGHSLLRHALSGLAEAGLARAIIVLGYGAEQIEAHLAAQPLPLEVETVRSDYRQPNGRSVLTAEPLISGEDVILAMCDHLVEPALYRRLALAGAGPGARLGVDHRLDSRWVDLEDVTRVAAEGERIVAIGKGLYPYNCFDTGVFAISTPLFAALNQLERPSLTDGMSVLAHRGAAVITDCSDMSWIDVDDHHALAAAEAWWRTRDYRHVKSLQ